jgi:CheY-like chemotaxis protein
MPNAKILVVDDEPAIRTLMKRLLESSGYQVWTAESVPDAEPQLETHQPDIVISDYVMPGENGLAFLSRLRDSHPHLIRVLLTGFADVRTALSAINDAHVHYFVVKPFEPQELLQTLADLLAAFPRPQPEVDRPQSIPDLDALARLREAHPGIDAVRRNTQGYIVLEEDPAFEGRLTDQYEAVLDLSAAAEPEAPAARTPAPVGKAPQREPTVLRNLKAEFPDIAELRRTKHGHILIDEDEMAALFEMDESQLLADAEPGDARAAEPQPDRPGSDPLTDWDDLESLDPRQESRTPKRMESEIVFDDSLLKLIGS